MLPHFDFKLVVAGPFASGKTTLVAAITDEVVGTEAPTSGAEAEVKELTTVGMEYGTLPLANDVFTAELGVYGVPGQERFKFMWSIVAEGMDGLVLLVDADRPETWDDSFRVGQYFQSMNPTPIVVGVNRASTRPDIVDDVERMAPFDGAQFIGFEVPDREQARQLFVTLLMDVLDALPDEEFDAVDGVTEGDPAEVSQ